MEAFHLSSRSTTLLGTPKKPTYDAVDKNLVQINVSSEELEQRIQNFIERKRDQVNLANIHDFIPDRDDAEVDTCARVRARFVKRCDSKGHLKIRKVQNEWGPQTVNPSDFQKAVKTEPGLPPAIAERVLAIESYLNLGPVPKDIYARLKAMEERIACLQAVSPEYALFWKNSDSDDIKQEPALDYTFSADDIGRKIEQLEKQLNT